MTIQTKSLDFETSAQIISFPELEALSGKASHNQSSLKRSPTLTRAAKWRAARYRRTRDLPRLASGLSSMRTGSPALLVRLRDIEGECQRALKDGAVHYQPERHVLALAALLAEDRASSRATGHKARC